MATTKKATRRAASKKTTKGAAPKRKDAASKSSPAKSPVTAQSPVKRFRAVVNRREGGEVCSIDIPFDVEKTFGGRNRVPVRGTLNGAPFRTSLFNMGRGYFFAVNRKMREAAGVRGGETVPVTLERDTEARTVTPPADFARALKANKDAQATWNKLSYTHQREHVEAIEGAKKSETRLRRIEKSVELLAAGKKPRG